MTDCLRVAILTILHNVSMDRETYVAPIVEAYIPDASYAEKLALTQEFWVLFDALYLTFEAGERFDFQALKMVESESLNQPMVAARSHPNL